MGDFFDLSKNVPSFLNENFFREIFKNKNFKILNCSIGTASKPGDNFVGAVYRVTLTTDDDQKQFIVKCPSDSSHETLHSYLSSSFVDELFACEMKMYEEVLPKILKLWRGVGYKDIWSPKLIYQSCTPQLTIMLEDVSPLGFATLESPNQDFEVSKMVAERLAKFHAASYYLSQEKLENFSDFRGNVYKNAILSNVIYNMGLAGFINVAREKPSLCRFTDKLNKFLNEFQDDIMKAYEPCLNGINVLCHNDFHMKNLLFKKDDDENIADLYAIDFQLCNYSSPAFDLIYALYYFVSSENRRHRRDEFIATYYNQFSASLNDFQFSKEIPSKKMLDDEFKRCAAHEILTAICLTIFYYFDLRNLNVEDLDMGEGTMKAKYRMFQNEDFLEMIEWQLSEFESRGIL